MSRPTRYRYRKFAARASAAVSVLSFIAAAVLVASTGHAEPEPDRAEPAAQGHSESDFDGDGVNDLAMAAFIDRDNEYGAIVVDYSSNVYDSTLTAPGSVHNVGFGLDLATGDLDGDGYDDLVVACIGCEPEDDQLPVTVWRGGDDGLVLDTDTNQGIVGTGRAVAVGDISPDGDSDYLDIASTRLGDTVGRTVRDGDGWATDVLVADADPPVSGYNPAVEIGDVTGDGDLDLVVGAPTGDSGSVTVFEGPVGDDSRQTTYFADDIDSSLARFGESLAIADVDQDAVDDIVVGAPGSEEKADTECGMIVTLPSTTHSQLIGQETKGVPGVCEAGDRFGYDLAVTGFNNVAVGVPGEDIGDISNAGGYSVLKCDYEGDCSGSFGVTQNSDNVPGNSEPDDRFGFALSADNTTTNDPVDLRVGMPGESVNGTEHAGGVLVAVYDAVGPPGPDSYDVAGTQYGVSDLGRSLG